MKYLLIFCTALMLAGCAKQTFYVNGARGALADENMDIFFVSGIGQNKSVNAAKVCGGSDRVAKVETETTLIDGLISGLSSSIVTPRTSRVYCLR